MVKSARFFTHAVLAMATVLTLILVATATTESFPVHAGEEETRSLSLTTEDHVQIRFLVTGQASNTLEFYITSPDGNVLMNFGTTGNLNYAFVCSQEGEYIMHFSNLASAENKLVSLDYEVQHYIFGIQQTLFLTLIVAVLCVAAVAVFVFMSRRP